MFFFKTKTFVLETNDGDLMYKGKRYNIIVASLVLAISFIISFAVISSKTIVLSSFDFTTDLESDADTEIDDAEDKISNVVLGMNVPSASASDYERLEFAFKVHNQGQGYTATCVQSVTGQVFGVSSTQHMTIKRYRGGGYDLAEEFYQCNVDPVLQSILGDTIRNDVRVLYSDGTNMHIKTLDDYSYSKLTYNPYDNNGWEKFSASNWINTQKRTPLNNYDVTLTKATCKEVKEFKKSEDYYFIRATLDPQKIDPAYIQIFFANGATAVNIIHHILEIKIDKKTGFVKEIIKSEKANVTQQGVVAETFISAKWIFTSMNKSAENKIKEIASPLLGITF